MICVFHTSPVSSSDFQKQSRSSSLCIQEWKLLYPILIETYLVILVLLIKIVRLCLTINTTNNSNKSYIQGTKLNVTQNELNKHLGDILT